jgi:hypothetical protein
LALAIVFVLLRRTNHTVEGQFVYKTLRLGWTVVGDTESGEGGRKGSVLELRLGGVSILRRYPTKISQIQAERDARAIAPRLLAIAEEWSRG